MLVIRQRQIEAFEQAALKHYEDEMVDHCRQFAPRLFEIRGESVIREVVRLGMERAKRYGFTLRGPMRFYIELMFTLGCHFDSDPQLPWARAILQDRDSPDQMRRADGLHDRMSAYLDRVAGVNNVHAVEALRKIRGAHINHYLNPGPHFQTQLLAALGDIYPQKYHYVGEAALRILFGQGVEVAKGYSITTQPGLGFIIALMFGFGQGVFNDPLYPWVHNTLTNTHRPDPDDRLERLHAKTMTYVNGMLDHLGE